MKKICSYCRKNEVVGRWYSPAQEVLSDICLDCFREKHNENSRQSLQNHIGNGICHYCGSPMSDDGCYNCRSEQEKKKKR